MNNSVTQIQRGGCSLSILNQGKEGWEKYLSSTGMAEKEPM